MFVRLLQGLGIRADADVVVLHLPLSSRFVSKMEQMGIVTREVSRSGHLPGSWFADSMAKLHLFSLVGYDRLLYVDADAIPLRSLDHLFELPPTEPLAAPIAY